MHRHTLVVGNVRRWVATIGFVIVDDRQPDLLEVSQIGHAVCSCPSCFDQTDKPPSCKDKGNQYGTGYG